MYVTCPLSSSIFIILTSVSKLINFPKMFHSWGHIYVILSKWSGTCICWFVPMYLSLSVNEFIFHVQTYLLFCRITCSYTVWLKGKFAMPTQQHVVVYSLNCFISGWIPERWLRWSVRYLMGLTIQIEHVFKCVWYDRLQTSNCMNSSWKVAVETYFRNVLHSSKKFLVMMFSSVTSFFHKGRFLSRYRCCSADFCSVAICLFNCKVCSSSSSFSWKDSYIYNFYIRYLSLTQYVNPSFAHC